LKRRITAIKAKKRKAKLVVGGLKRESSDASMPGILFIDI